MKFKVQLGPRARASKFPYLTLQASYGHMYLRRKVKIGPPFARPFVGGFDSFGVAEEGEGDVISISYTAVVV